MKLNLNKIINIQKKLDKYIEDNHKLESKDLVSRKKLALIIEISELCNEVRCFKYWSIKKMSTKNIILNEFVDCFHFILSIGIFYGIDLLELDLVFEYKKKDNIELSNFFIELIHDVKSINNKKSSIEFIKKLFELAYNLDLSNDEIVDYYYKKNEINFKRQNEKY